MLLHALGVAVSALAYVAHLLVQILHPQPEGFLFLRGCAILSRERFNAGFTRQMQPHVLLE